MIANLNFVVSTNERADCNTDVDGMPARRRLRRLAGEKQTGMFFAGNRFGMWPEAAFDRGTRLIFQFALLRRVSWTREVNAIAVGIAECNDPEAVTH